MSMYRLLALTERERGANEPSMFLHRHERIGFTLYEMLSLATVVSSMTVLPLPMFANLTVISQL